VIIQYILYKMSQEQSTQSVSNANNAKSDNILDGNAEFQIIDWYSENYDKRDSEDDSGAQNEYGGYNDRVGYESDDEEREGYEYDEEQERYIRVDENGDPIEQEELSAQYTIYMFGRDMNNRTYNVEVREFTPYFYIRIPDGANSDKHRKAFEEWVRQNMGMKHRDGLLRTTLLQKKSFRNFDNHKTYNFVRLVFNNTTSMQNAVGLFQDRVKSASDDRKSKLYPKRNLYIPGIKSPQGFIYSVYENMIDSLLKFIHHKSIQPVGWVRLPKGKFQIRDNNLTHCDYNLSVCWNDVKVVERDTNSPFRVMAFDIECDSAHGDFPLPIKDYTKLGREIYMTYLKIEKKITELRQEARTLEKSISYTEARLAEQEKEKEKEKSKKANAKKSIVPSSSLTGEKMIENIPEAKEDLERIQVSLNSLVNLMEHKREYAWACIHKAFGLVPEFIEVEEGEEDDEDDEEEKVNEKDKKKGKNASFDPDEPMVGSYDWIYNYRTYIDDINTVYPKNASAKPAETVIKRVSKVIENQLVVPTDEKSIDRKNAQAKAIQHIIDSLNKNFPALEGDKTIQIGMSFIKYGQTTPYQNYMITVGTCTPLHNAITIECQTERELLLKFREILLKEDPDIITGYNIDGFDTAWLFKRASECGISDTFSKLSRFNDFKSILKERQVKSATGELVRREYVELPGRIQLDIMPQVQKSYNLESYKLDDVSAEFMNGKVESFEYDEKADRTKIYTNATKGMHVRNYVMFNEIDGYLEKKYRDGQKFEVRDMGVTDDGKKWFIVDSHIKLNMTRKCLWCLGKDDTSPSDIFRLQKGTAEDRYIIAKYCMMDVILCIELLNKLELLNNNIGMANVCRNPLSWIINRGQGVKILSLVAYFIREKGYLLPFLYKDLIERESYEGAVVLDPMPNIYIDDPISVLDYGSLYPSSMIERNLSHETIISANDKTYLGEEGAKLLNELGYDYEDVTYDTYGYTSNGSKVKTGVKTVRYVQYRDGSKGIIPQILQYLIKNRKDTRNKIAYQTCVLSNGKTVTGMYNEKKRTIRDDKGTFEIPEGVTVVSTEETYNEFQQKVLDGLQLAFKITANSLYGQIGAMTSDIYYKEIAASTTATGRERLIQAKEYAENTQNYPQKLNDGRTIYLQNKVIYGDSCTGDTPIMLRVGSEIQLQTIADFDESKWSAYREFKSDDPELTDKQQVNMENENVSIWTHKGWAKVRRVIRHHTYKKIYRVLTHQGCVDVTEDHSLLDLNANQIKPKDCQIGMELLHSFPMCGSIGTLYDTHEFKTESKLEAQRYYTHNRDNGYHVSIQVIDSQYILERQWTPIENNAIVDIRILHEKYDDYVYDIETEAGVFHAGIGSMIIKNTDSVFVRFQCLDDDGKPLSGREARAKSIKLAIDTEHAIQKTILRDPQVLEYEKTFHPFILFSKKRYIGDLYEFDPDKFARKSMGIVLKRRDNAPIVKIVYGEVIDTIMKEKNIPKAVSLFQRRMRSLANNEHIDIDTLIITKTLSSFYKDPDRIAHKVLADRMAERDPGNRPLTGDRIPFVYIKKKGKNVLQGDRIEHPDYYKQQMMNTEFEAETMKIDAEFYIMNQVRKPVTQIFALCIDKIPGFKGDMKVYDKKYKELITEGKHQINECIKRVNELKRRDVEKLIMSDVMIILGHQRDKTQSIENFFKKVSKNVKEGSEDTSNL
jgi:DNA polymerase elongation subunit (family B)